MKKKQELAQGNRDAYLRTHWSRGRREPLPNLQVGEIVAYMRYFLICTGHEATSPAWQLRGEVLELLSGNRARILWREQPSPYHYWAERPPIVVSTYNLARPGPNLRFGD